MASGPIKKITSIANGNVLTSGDLNDLKGASNAGFYYIQTGVAHSPQNWSWLLVMGGTGTVQVVFTQNKIILRAYTGSPLAWTDWVTIQ